MNLQLTKINNSNLHKRWSTRLILCVGITWSFGWIFRLFHWFISIRGFLREFWQIAYNFVKTIRFFYLIAYSKKILRLRPKKDFNKAFGWFNIFNMNNDVSDQKYGNNKSSDDANLCSINFLWMYVLSKNQFAITLSELNH